jgi:hypothetical protein
MSARIYHLEAFFAMRRVKSDCERTRRFIAHTMEHTDEKRARIDAMLDRIEAAARRAGDRPERAGVSV